MNKKLVTLIAMAGLSAQAGAASYSDNVLARSGQMSPFDRVYEAGRAQSVTQPADYLKSQENPAAVLDLSRDEPLSSIEETETEKTYRKTIKDLEQSKSELNLAREQARQQLMEAQAHAEKAAAERKNNLARQEDELRNALQLNLMAQQEAARVKTEHLADISAIKTESDRLLMMAEASAEVIETQAKKRVTLERIDPTVVLNEPVTAEYQGATLQEIVQGIMPVGWRVKTDFGTKPELLNRRYDFVTTDARDVALRKLTGSIRDARVRFQYFWDLTDSSGNPAPMVILTDRPN
jgi:hypothetical protein